MNENQRRAAVRRALGRLFGPAIEVTEEAIDAVLAELPPGPPCP